MSLLSYGPFYGEVADAELPKLPDGFTYSKRSNRWLNAIGPDGRRWFVFKDRLEILTVATEADNGRTDGRLKVGQEFVGDEKIEL